MKKLAVISLLMTTLALGGCRQSLDSVVEKTISSESSGVKKKTTDDKMKENKNTKDSSDVRMDSEVKSKSKGIKTNDNEKEEPQKETVIQETARETEEGTDSQESVSADPRTLDPQSIYYQATPEELAEGAKREQEAQDKFHAQQLESSEESNSSQDSINRDPSTLTDFLNTYGMTPTLYKIQVEGMSEEEALKSTPQNMKTSGEIQSEYLKYIQPFEKANTELDEENEEEHDEEESDLELLGLDEEEYDHNFDEDRYDEGQYQEDFDEMDDY
ncbi:hypothetical protein [Vagococcus intermedius]|uniref:Lipoprotein n=1 Tax=Vagococcus intermedius TaxID=2991418 RepID=A0AAF0I680_9ENTE|nr:hypothetical protein [Vagococcus intermedius]WEG72525.1 hypothetical protein OL234_05930 [Vagococcus intermedius]WEG74613.1 hypothetical protein OL235_05935 [Vagococcus intermedius]